MTRPEASWEQRKKGSCSGVIWMKPLLAVPVFEKQWLIRLKSRKDYLSIYLKPIAAGGNDNENYALLYVYPTGGGMAGNEPYVGEWRDFVGFQPLRAKVSRRLKTGGYTIEAAVPLKIGADMPLNLGLNCKLKMVYQNANEIYRTIVRNKIIFRP